MCDNANESKIEQLSFVMPGNDYSTLFCEWVDGELLAWLDQERMLFAGFMEDSPTGRRIFDNPPVFWYTKKYRYMFEKVVWL